MKMGQYCPSIKIRFAIRGEEGKFWPESFGNLRFSVLLRLVNRISILKICVQKHVFYQIS